MSNTSRRIAPTRTKLMVFMPAQCRALTTIAAETLRCAVPKAITATAHKLRGLIYRAFG